jgi:hypothetical protein
VYYLQAYQRQYPNQADIARTQTDNSNSTFEKIHGGPDKEPIWKDFWLKAPNLGSESVQIFGSKSLFAANN